MTGTHSRGRAVRGRVRRLRPRRLVIEPLESRQLLAELPIISEFLASNQTGLTDAQGRRWDWIEIFNPADQPLDLTGWKLRDGGNTWPFPAGTTLGPLSFRIVFASDGAAGSPGELHANFALKKDGEYLGLLDPGNTVIHEYAPQYPPQADDMPYGIGQQVQETKLVAAGATASYHVPADGTLGQTWTQSALDDSAWAAGPAGLGFANRVPGLAVSNYKSNVSLANVTEALGVINTPSQQTWVQSETAPVYNYLNTGGSGHFTGDRTYPGLTINTDADWFVTRGVGTVLIPAAGSWTFGVNSDDGFRLTIGSQSVAFAGLRGPGDTLGTFNFPAAGEYDLTIVSFENGGGSSAELFAAQGSFTSWAGTSTWKLVGDTAHGGLAVVSLPPTGGTGSTSGFASLVATNVRDAMQAAGQASLYARFEFDVADPQSLQSLLLKMKYDDGYVAWLNGTEIARRNAPDAVTYNSQATAERTDAEATLYENVNVSQHLGLLTPANNVLAVQIMNWAPADGDLLLLPELAQVVYQSQGEHYFATPTPGDVNSPDYWYRVEDTKFSADRGFYEDPFALTITTATPGATIRYTLDNSTPTETSGTVYTGPITITTTTAVRAIAYKTGYVPSDVDTQTYIFLDDVLQQPAAPAGFPLQWTDASGSPVAADYAMDSRIVQDPTYGATLKQDLLSLPTVSIVTDTPNLFDPATGIYANPDTAGWERPASLEYFLPDGSEDFQLDMGLRMYGGVGRRALYKKHSFRVLFKDEYGASKLVYPLFGESGATDTFDGLVLRSNFNDGWTWGGATSQYIRDEFAGQSQIAMGQPGRHGTFVHLYVNGLYWGLYNPVERPDTSFSATYFGGDKDNWDGVNAGEAVGESTLTSWNQLMNFDNLYDLTANDAYQLLQGNRPDGTDDPAVECLMDVNNYIDYLLLNFYIGNTDWPGHNWYTGRERGAASSGFKYYSWDAEWSLLMNSALTVDRTGVTDSLAEAYRELKLNPEFQMLWADHAQRHLFNGGVLTPTASGTRYQELADLVQRAIIAESARWGDVVATTPFTQANWLNMRDQILNTYLPQRTAIVIQQFRTAGLYPAIDAPALMIDGTPQHGGTVQPGAQLEISAATGTVYYTLDGTDPRLTGGAISPAALAYSGPITLSAPAQVKARAWDGSVWSALCEAPFYIDLAPSIRISEVMYNPAAPTAAETAAGFTDDNQFEFLEITNIGTQTLPLAGLRLADGVEFTFPEISLAPGQYVVVVRDQAAFQQRYGTGITVAGVYTGSLNNAGEALKLDAPNGGLVQEFTYDDGWYDHTDGEGFSLTVRAVDQPLAAWDTKQGWRASRVPGGSPGAADNFLSPGDIIIHEVLAHTDAPWSDSIELYNTTDQPIDIDGWFLSDEAADLAKYRIAAGTVIPAHGYVAFTAAADFGPGSGDPGALEPFGLSEYGDEVFFTSGASGVVGGYREHVDFEPTPTNYSVGLHRVSTGDTDFTLLQTPTFGAGPNYPGAANSLPYQSPLVVNEIMYHPADPSAAELAAGYLTDDEFEFLEIYNRSGVPQTLQDYYVGDGVGFTCGWTAADRFGNEFWTLEPGATATWTTEALAGETYHVYARYDLLDAFGNERKLDDAAQYQIEHAEGTATRIIDQDDEAGVYTDPLGWIDLGSYAFDGAGTVRLTRGPVGGGDWTIADQVRFVRDGETVTLDNPTLDSPWTQSGPRTIDPGAYLVLVSNDEAFDARYGVAANVIPLLGTFSGQLNNGSETVDVYRSGVPDPVSGFVPWYRLDHVDYEDHAPWAEEPDGAGPALARLDAGQYGNDPVHWGPSNLGGTPGRANVPLDKTAPSTPTNVTAVVLADPAGIFLSWDAAVDPESGIGYYVIYRDGEEVGTASGTTYTDLAVTPVSPFAHAYTYRVSAVNRDLYEGTPTPDLPVTMTGVVAYRIPDATHIELDFSEALTAESAQLPANYTLAGAGPAGVQLVNGGTRIRLTASAALVLGTQYTLVLEHLASAAGNELPGHLELGFTYAPQGAGMILREYWTGITGTRVLDLTVNANFPDNISGKSFPTLLEAPTNFADNYGARFRGYVHPPVSGDYTFWIAGDETSELWLSTDEDPAHAQRIALVPGATAARTWTTYPEQQSVAIRLESGRRYYLEALHKEGTGGDHLAVRWQLPGGVWENPASPDDPIPGLRLSPYDHLPDQTPPSVPTGLCASVPNNTAVVLEWNPASDAESGVHHYLVYRDGSLYATLPGTATTYTDTSVAATARHTYRIAARNPDWYASAQSAGIMVQPSGLNSLIVINATTLRVTFTEAVVPAAATNVANYSIPGLTVQAASLATDNFTLTLTTTAMTPGTTYTLTVSNVTTISGNPFPSPLPGTFALTGSILWQYWTGITGSTVADLTGNTRYPNSPSGSQQLTLFEARKDWTDNYGGRMVGYLYPPTTGNYEFWIASDDCSELWLSTTESSANRVKIASVDGWTGSREWAKYPSQHSAAIALTAGQRYYIEAIQKEGLGGDNLAVAWQLPGTTFNTTNGVPIAGTYLSPIPVLPTGITTVARVNTLTTHDATPQLTGVIQNATYGMTIYVNGRFYAANNNGNNTWTLPDNVIRPPLPAGTYEVSGCVVSSSNRIIFDTTRLELTIINDPPTAVTANPNPASLAENTSTANSVKVADLAITDDAAGTNALSLTGVDAGSFLIVGTELHLKANTELDYETQPSYRVTVQVDDTTVGATPDASVLFTLNLTDVDETRTLIVTQFLTTSSGFAAHFSRALEPGVLNLYDSVEQTLGAADVTMTGATVGPVRGSLVLSADRREIAFVQAGGMLAPGTYTVTLFSGAARFRDTSGETLDGNADGMAGDDYQTTFTVAARPAGTVTISLPDVARGAGQPVNVPATGSGLPIRLDKADGVTSLAMDLRYDPTLLNITAATLAAGLPGDWSVVNPPDINTPGVAKIRASGTTPLSGTNVDVVRLTAAVPGTAPYGVVQAIRLENVSLSSGAIAAIGDMAVHKAVYLGDADGSGIHSSADAFLTVQAALGLASGFADHVWTDPQIVGDADASGALSAADAFLIVQEGAGLVEPFVPDNPHIGITPVGGGVDPQFQIGVNLPARAGEPVSVPVKLNIEPAATNVGAFEFDLFFEPSRLTIQLPQGVAAGADTAGWAVSATLVAAGHLRVGMASSNAQPLAPGLREIARLQFHVKAGRSSRTGWQPVPRCSHRSPIAALSDGSETHPTLLDIEPVDPRAGGYTWTDADGSVLIRPTERAAVAVHGCQSRDDT